MTRALFQVSLFQVFLVLSLALSPPARAKTSWDTHPCLTANPTTSDSVARSTLSTCSSLLLNPLDGMVEYDALVQRGIAHRTLGDFVASVDDLHAALEIMNLPDGQRMLAWTLNEMGDHAASEALFTASIAQEDHWQARLSRCVVRQNQGRHADALPDCQLALQAQPDSADPNYFTALSLVMLNRPAEAEPLARRAIALDDNPYHVVILGWALHDQGRARAAHRLAREALRRFPEDPTLLLFLEESGARGRPRR